MDFVKLKNIYGIKELRNASYIKGNTLIYAPNGVMKTSFADFLDAVRVNNPIVDVFGEYESSAEYEVVQSGKVYTEKSNDGSLQVLVFSSKIAKDNVFSDPALADIAMSAVLRKAYDEQISRLKELRKQLDSIVCLDVKGSKKLVSGSWIDIAQIFDANDETTFLKSIIDYESIDVKLFSGAAYSKVCDQKIVDIFKDQEFEKKIEMYKEIVDRKMEDEVFNNGFTFFELEDINASISKTHFFDAAHSLKISDIEITSSEYLNAFVEMKRKEVFTSREVEKAFNEVKASLNKNAATRNFADFLSSNREILKYSSDYNEARKTFCRTKVSSEIGTLEKLYIDFKDCIGKLNSLIEKSRTEESTWKKSKDLFNSRFSLNRIDLDIITIMENDLPIPRIVLVDKGSRKQINSSMKSRLSSGEYRALLILNLLFEIEAKRNLWPDGFTLVLDDIADSFDYKNKYAICRYIEELFRDKIIQVIVMTHNYDFYRCCSFFLSKITHKSLVASRLRKGVIEIKNAGHTDLLNLAFAKSWKGMLESEEGTDCSQTITLLAYLPVLRNLIELKKDGSKSEDYKLISYYLHYSEESYNQPFMKLKPLITKYDLIINEAYYNMTFKQILEKAYQVGSPKKIDSFDIRSKTALASILRIIYEKFIFEKSGKKPSDYKDSDNSACLKLYDKLLSESMLSEKDKDYCEFARIVANPYIHVNAFMYEQLIDNSADKIIECLKYFVTNTNF